MRSDLLDRRNLSYQLNIWDDINLDYEVNHIDIKSQVLNFFRYGSELIYPAKTIFVAIVYSWCMNKYFNVNFYDALSDLELLPDDLYFKEFNYLNQKDLYDSILIELSDLNNLDRFESVTKTVNYFRKEFLIDGTNNKTYGKM